MKVEKCDFCATSRFLEHPFSDYQKEKDTKSAF
jgi:hypothetical protein